MIYAVARDDRWRLCSSRCRSWCASWCRSCASSVRKASRRPTRSGRAAGGTFWSITLPSIRWGVAYGVTLTVARSLGEFGAVLVVSGNLIGKTQTATLYIHDGIESFHTEGAYAASLVLAAVVVCLAGGDGSVRKTAGRPTGGARHEPDFGADHAKLGLAGTNHAGTCGATSDGRHASSLKMQALRRRHPWRSPFADLSKTLRDISGGGRRLL